MKPRNFTIRNAHNIILQLQHFHQNLILRFCSTSHKAANFNEYGGVVRVLDKYMPERIRNFAIIAHIDHGKSTLSDRLLQLTNVISTDTQAQYLDKLEVERERGITVKAQTCTMFHKEHMLNLIDTPGHVDFSFEVRRSLVTCDGAILLVAANQGVQAQTIFNFWAAFENNLTIIPVINKVDMPTANVEKVEKQLQSAFGFNPEEMLRISAKTGMNVPSILDAVIQRMPAPSVNVAGPIQAHVIDSWYDHYKGAVLLVVVKQGTLKRNLPIRLYSNPEKELIVSEVGFLHPEATRCEALHAGQVGYIHCGIKAIRDVTVGDTLFHSSTPVEHIKPFVEISNVRPCVYSGLFPMVPSDYDRLRDAVERLQLNDPSVTLESDSSAIFGQGFQIGFVGNLHMEVFGQRIEQEHGELFVFTVPTVEYVAELVDNESIWKRRHNGQSRITISKPSSYPEVPTDVARFLEPMTLVSIVSPSEYFQAIESLCMNSRGEPIETTYLDETRVLLKWRLPLVEVIIDFFEELKRVTSGYASFDQKDDGYRECALEKVTVWINDKQVDELSFIYPQALAHSRANRIVERLKKGIPRQQFEVVIKACLGHSKKAVAQAKIAPMKKDFTQVLKGNFVADRFGKKLKHQREGKEKLKMLGTVQVPREAFLNIVKKG